MTRASSKDAGTPQDITMGLCGSKSTATVDPTESGGSQVIVPTTSAPKSEFDKRMTMALQRYKEKSKDIPKSERVSSFNQVLLRSQRIVKALDAVRQVFKKFDVDNSNSMDYGELTSALKVLGNDVSDEDAEKVFHEADLYDNNKLSEKEFIVCLLLGYVLGDLKLGNDEADGDDNAKSDGKAGIDRKNTGSFYGHTKELQWAFNNIIGTYLLFGKYNMPLLDTRADTSYPMFSSTLFLPRISCFLVQTFNVMMHKVSTNHFIIRIALLV